MSPLGTSLLTSLPDPLAVGGGSAVFLEGLSARAGSSGGGSIRLGSASAELLGAGVPPPRQPRGRDYWWTVLGLPTGMAGRLPLDLVIGQESEREPLGTVELTTGIEIPGEHLRAADQLASRSRGAGPLVAICMAAFEPRPEQLRRQLATIRAQTHQRWICLIGDDGSSPSGLAALEAEVRADERFLIVPWAGNVGAYRNFERTLALVPAAAEYVALSDQDDHWFPEKLETLIGAIQSSGARLAYSDMKIVQGERVISDTYWSLRPNNHTDYGALLLANTVTGAASLFHRDLLEDALPFPPRVAKAFHDHWIAQVAMTLGDIAYVDRPLYDYVQHADASIGHLAANASGTRSGSRLARGAGVARRLRRRRGRLAWRLPYFRLYCRTLVATTALELRCGERASSEKRATLSALGEPGSAARWMAARVVAGRLGESATMGSELAMLGGLIWAETTPYRYRAQGPAR